MTAWREPSLVSEFISVKIKIGFDGVAAGTTAQVERRSKMAMSARVMSAC